MAATNGTILVVGTPGRSQNFVLHWFKEPGKSKVLVTGTVDDADHMTAQQKADLAATYRSVSEAEFCLAIWARNLLPGDTRFRSTPTMFITSMNAVTSAPRPAGSWAPTWDMAPGREAIRPRLCWPRIIMTLTACTCARHRKNQVLPGDVASAIRRWPHAGAPTAWGAAENSTAGMARKSFKDLFADEGFRMLPEHATHKDGSVYIETSVSDIQQRLRDGRLLIHPDCQDLIHELLDLERDQDGKVIPIRDDLFAALRYLLMCLKSAKTDTELATGLRNPFEKLYAQQQQSRRATLDADAGEKYYGIDY